MIKQPEWFVRAVADACREIERHPDGDLPLSARQSIWTWIHEQLPVHAKFRRNVVYFITCCGTIPRWTSNRRVPVELRDVPISAARLCRDALLELVDVDIVAETFDSLEFEAHKFSANYRREMGVDPGVPMAEPCAMLAMAMCLYYVQLPTMGENLDDMAGFEGSRPYPDRFGCLEFTNYPLAGLYARERVAAYWKWWLSNVLPVAVLPFEELTSLLLEFDFSEHGVSAYIFR